MKLVLLGPPGAGKGTQAEKLSKELGIPQISTGDIIRAAIKNETPIGKIAKEAIERGELVSDEMVLEIVKDRLKDEDCKDGYILDGFPRTLVQAEMMQKGSETIDVDFVIDIDVYITLESVIKQFSFPVGSKIMILTSSGNITILP